MYRDIYRVSRNDYKSFINRLNSGVVRVEEVSVDENIKQINVYSKKTEKLLCARETAEGAPELYYIFEYPDNDEWHKPIPRVKVELETPEEVQALLDGLAKMRKEQND